MPRKSKSEPPAHVEASRPALSPEMREKQMIAYAVDLAEKQLKDGTASAQVITHYLKLGTEKEKLERVILEKQAEMITAKTKSIQSTERLENLYAKALEDMKRYRGDVDDE